MNKLSIFSENISLKMQLVFLVSNFWVKVKIDEQTTPPNEQDLADLEDIKHMNKMSLILYKKKDLCLGFGE